ncbi:MAG: ATP-binding cassette domain-containing protein [Clostridiales bacterium]|nr:ATP-binding cassette domain-containing protein [Clostridiales bacterium]
MVICDNLVKIYKAADIEVVALQGLDLTVEKGELMAIIGNSGSGKSTLLNILGGLDRPSAGKVFVNGQDLLKLTDKQLVKYKRETVGFVWQNNARNLIPYLTALENVELPMFFTGSAKRQRALELLDMVGLSHRKNNKLEQLSGGEQQRVAIAIALANNPSLLLADEPTGAVDTRTASHILDVFREINEALGVTIIIVTHDRQIASKVDRVVAIRDGRTSSEFVRKKSYAEELAEISNDIGTVGGDTHVELAVIDRAGRLQIPREYVEALGLGEQNRVLVEMDGDRIVLRSPDTTLQSEQRTAGSDAV